ncbi:MAG: hypothetical protein ACXWF8_04705 [Methylobacter sp.]
MKRFLQRSVLRYVLALPCLLTIAVAHAGNITTVFTTPTEYCFEQTVLRGDLDKTTLDYNLIIDTNDQFKNGNVFVGFRRRSQPDALWLSNGTSWSAYDSGNPVDVYANSYLTRYGSLQPVMHLPIIYLPQDLTAFAGDGEIWVGYGLRNSATETVKDAYQDMINNQRYKMIWSIGIGLVGSTTAARICLSATQMSVFKSNFL